MNKNCILLLTISFLLNSSGLFAQNHILMPQPQNISWGKSNFLIAGAKILVSPDLFSREQNSITQFTDFVKQTAGVSISITYSDDHQGHLIILNSEQVGQALPLPNEKPGSQSRESYTISVTPARVQVNAKSDAGLFYSLQTLRQLIVNDQNKSYIPEVEIDDYPQFVYRGVMMDFSHGGLLTEEEIKRQIDFLALWKMNQYYFYNEVSIEMKGYSLINYNACYSQDQIKRIVAYACEKHMDVIPFLELYGHLHELIRLEKYAALGVGKYGHEIDPMNPGVQILLKDWIKQYVDMFPSPFIHVGFDETWETERLAVQDSTIKPKERYLKQLNFVTRILREFGKTVMIWTDITNTHPDILSEFPKGLVPVIWEYSDNPAAMTKWLKPVKKEKLPFFVQSAVDSWGNVYPAANYTYDNIDICLKTSRDEKAIGYITSVWTDAVQPLLRNTWLYMAYGSIGAWQKEPVERVDFISRYCKLMYPGIFDQMTIAFRKMSESEDYLAKCLGMHTLEQMWDDPFSTYHLKNTNSHIEDYKNARIAAEASQENLIEALHTQTADTSFIKTMMVNCRQLEYTASRFIWARTMVDRWNWIDNKDPKGEKDYVMYYDINYTTHGLLVDMMDQCTEMKEEYSKAWLSENMPYRLGTMLGRFDSEYLLWRNLSLKIADFRNHNENNGRRPKFEELFLIKN